MYYNAMRFECTHLSGRCVQEAQEVPWHDLWVFKARSVETQGQPASQSPQGSAALERWLPNRHVMKARVRRLSDGQREGASKWA